MQATLAATALLMGLAGGPHCVAMCGAACRGVACSGASSPSRSMAWLMGGRLLGYAAGGALAAASASTLAAWSAALPWLRPWWAMLHVAAIALGVWLLWQGRQPRWLRAAGAGVAQRVDAVAWPAPRRRGAWRAALFGTLWVAWPCGLLQSALLLAALSGGAVDGALTMALFAAGSSLTLWAAPLLWGRLLPGRAGGRFAAIAPEAAVRLAGAALALASAWALLHALQRDIAAFCA